VVIAAVSARTVAAGHEIAVMRAAEADRLHTGGFCYHKFRVRYGLPSVIWGSRLEKRTRCVDESVGRSHHRRPQKQIALR